MLRVNSPLGESDERIVTAVVDCGYAVHCALGPGYRERIYERAFCLELHARGLPFECQKEIRVTYKQWSIPGQKIDLIVESLVLVEIKAVPALKRIHRAQIVSYLETLNLRIGLLINFNTVLFKQGVRRIVN